MNKRVLLFHLLLLICLVEAASAQDKGEKNLRDKYDQARLEELQRQQEQLLAEIQASREVPSPTFLDKYLPLAKDSWTVTLVAHGGILGGPRILSGINSEGNYFCDFNGTDLITKPVSRDKFERIAQVVSLDLPVKRSKVFESKNSRISHCSDCAVHSLVITQRRNNKLVELRFTFPISSLHLAELYEFLNDRSICEGN